MAGNDAIILRGVRVHNLKNIDLDVPVDRFIAVTGVSGSGKSSLAFDTLYAEGQRRYIESLSAYARQFLERMDKPDAERIEGILPAVAIRQLAAAKNPRSTVATVTEIYDYLRVLYARIGVVHCVKCGRPLKRDTIDDIVDGLEKLGPGTKLLVTFSTEGGKSLASLRKEGFSRVVIAGAVREMAELDPVEAAAASFDVLVDRITIGADERERIVDSVEAALKRGAGRAKARTGTGGELLFSAALECKVCGLSQEDPYPNLFSFNNPQGACPVCHGFGDQAVLDEDKLVPDPSLSLDKGAIEPWTRPIAQKLKKEMLAAASKQGIPTNVPFKDLTAEQKNFIIEGGGKYHGVKGFFDWLQSRKYKIQVRVMLSRYRKYVPCSACSQTRLNEQALSVKVGGLNMGQFLRMTVKEADDFLERLELGNEERTMSERLRQEVRNRLGFLLKVGLDYITLDRMTFTLSGGEAQRINLASALGSSLVGTLFVLDEPSIGLHPRDNERLVQILRSLRDLGNTVVVVEHEPDIIRAAEYVIEIGPRAGEAGGEVVYAGPAGEFIDGSSSLTAQYLRGEREIRVPDSRRTARNHLVITGAEKFNLKNINVSIPLGILTCLTGVSGSGKSTLLYDVIYKAAVGVRDGGYRGVKGADKISRAILVDQGSLSTSPRSIIATYAKAMDGIRDLFSSTREAKLMGFKPGAFSFNTPGGRCEVCKGAGFEIIEMQFLSDVMLTCEACNGKRFKKDILEIRWNGRTIDEVLGLSVSEASLFFAGRTDITHKLAPLIEVGLGYLKLGQPTSCLSGGELQRIKLAHYLEHDKGGRGLYLFDEPTIGLHPHDINLLLRSFERLLAEGNTVVIIEHNLDVIKCADFVIDLGPEGGEGGGRIVAQGTPEKIASSRASYTGRYLRSVLAHKAA